MRRFPARDSRWRVWSPEEAPSGAVPFQEAKWPRLAKRWMSEDRGAWGRLRGGGGLELGGFRACVDRRVGADGAADRRGAPR